MCCSDRLNSPRKAVLGAFLSDVCFTPDEQTSASASIRFEKCHYRKCSGLFDHLVGAAEQRWQDLDAELFCRLAVRSIISGHQPSNIRCPLFPHVSGRTRLRSRGCPRNKAKHEMLVAKNLVNPGTPAAQVATAVRTLTLYFFRRNGDPIAVTADLAGDPITVFNSRLCGRTVSLVAA
jgi:hypothetical protein